MRRLIFCTNSVKPLSPRTGIVRGDLNRLKDDEEAAAARKWKLAKQLQTASQEELYQKTNEREATRLIRAYFQTLDEIIEKFPGTHSAEEAKAVYRGDIASNSR